MPSYREKGIIEGAAEDAGRTLQMLFEAIGWMRSAPRKLRDIRNLTAELVFTSMPMVFIIGLFSGFILALQAGRELMRIEAQGQVGVVVGASMCRAMGPVMAALAFAGLIGSSFAAEISTMKVKEEIDALEVMSIDPIYFLVMPRLVAVALALPIMTIYTNVIGILGGALVAQLQLGVDSTIYFSTAFDEGIKLRDIYGGLLKSVVFGITIALVACSRGMKAEGGAEGVGSATRWTVVVSFTLIVVFDYFMDWALYPR